MTNNIYKKILIIGVGLIGSSIARGIKKHNICSEIYGIDKNEEVISKCEELKILNDIKKNINEFSIQFDLIIICVPLNAYKEVFMSLCNYINKFTLVTVFSGRRSFYCHHKPPLLIREANKH